MQFVLEYIFQLWLHTLQPLFSLKIVCLGTFRFIECCLQMIYLEANVTHLPPTSKILISSIIDTIVVKLEFHFNAGNESIRQTCISY